jgi:NitT/TauT family transport system permease protein
VKGTDLKWSAISILAFFLFWEIIARSRVFPPILFPPPSEVLATGFDLLQSGILLESVGDSLVRVVLGILLGLALAIPVGLLMGWVEKCDKLFGPIISLLFPIPGIAWLPLLIVWVGLRPSLPILLISIVVFFPVLLNIATGVKSVDRENILAARTLGSSELRILVSIIIPLSIPFILTGIRIEVALAWRVLVAAEMIAIPTGIGALMSRSESLLQIKAVMVCLGLLSIIGLIMDGSLRYLEKRLTAHWRAS